MHNWNWFEFAISMVIHNAQNAKCMPNQYKFFQPIEKLYFQDSELYKLHIESNHFDNTTTQNITQVYI